MPNVISISRNRQARIQQVLENHPTMPEAFLKFDAILTSDAIAEAVMKSSVIGYRCDRLVRQSVMHEDDLRELLDSHPVPAATLLDAQKNGSTVYLLEFEGSTHVVKLVVADNIDALYARILLSAINKRNGKDDFKEAVSNELRKAFERAMK